MKMIADLTRRFRQCARCKAAQTGLGHCGFCDCCKKD